VETITSIKNPLIKRMRSLREKKYREAEGMYLMEGARFVADALAYGAKAQYLFAEERHRSLIDRHDGASAAFLISEEVSRSLSAAKTQQGIYAAFGFQNGMPVLSKAERVLYLDGLADPENIGSLVRSAVCAGFDAVLAGGASADFYSPPAVRASAGAVVRLPLYRGPSSLSALKEAGFHIYSCDAGGVRAGEFALPYAIAVGSEAAGLSAEVIAASEAVYAIPMEGGFDSLNAAVAGALMLFKSRGF